MNLTDAFSVVEKMFLTHVRNQHPEAFNYTNFCYGEPSMLHFKNHPIESSCSVQQGDPGDTIGRRKSNQNLIFLIGKP